MEYKAKHKLWKEMHDTAAVNRDIELLRKKNPKANSLRYVERLSKGNPGRLEKEILYELLDVATEKEIIDNRKSKEAAGQVHSVSVEPEVKKAQPVQPSTKKKSPKKKSTPK